MSNIPNSLKYTKDHEWIRLNDDGTGIIGITHHAQESLGDITFVELPDIGVAFAKSEALGVVESVKAASDLFMPIAGEVIEVNEQLLESPELVNDDAYGEGWMVKIRLTHDSESNDLLAPEAYSAIAGAE
ncbi:MAG: glycine cleavage system protein GcvH [Opitutae bacterium]|jgi:glycine cleavage system H protein|nr:glycine cleavage system protein GcvH [Opitutae bacterium]MBT4225623.1 glycine cleavage system protein GcvH [Opitutae bacterium]MBT5378600.1 glycine cleavage system protein GcvH [Opitutae bacterium]MBT6461765.1 glycine cleavage system protein GcvH [Opitutae bacterium]MBT7852167.1 glycine cleavage system protein GcvH [Opitutae bacterium]